jgi:outer membrane protein assembly factor BamB
MTVKLQHRLARLAAMTLLGATIVSVSGCSSLWPFSSDNANKPMALAADPGRVQIRSLWSTRLGDVRFPLTPGVSASSMALAATDGTVVLLDTTSGRDLWRAKLPDTLTAGAGTDGQTVAVVTQGNDVVAIQSGNVLWRSKLASRAYTAPLVAGGRVFVLTADRTVTALDGKNGARLWTQNRQQGEPLVIQQAGVIFAVGDTLVTGHSGRFSGINPANGSPRWEAPIAFARGSNDIERVVDLMAPFSRQGDVVCARAYFSTVGCVDARQGQVIWTSQSRGAVGLGGDARAVYGADQDGRVHAWNRRDGARLWSNEGFMYRGLNAPAAEATRIVVGDAAGYVHWLSKDNGALLGRAQIDNSPVLFQFATGAGSVIAVSRNGTVTALSAQ